MRRALTERFDGADLESFRWSGRNTHRARVQAALDLAAHLDQLADRDVVIVAHSHGGNVALGALRTAAPTHRKRTLVTLATPFLAPGRPVEHLPSMAITLAAGWLVITVLGLIGVVPALLPMILTALLVVHGIAVLYSWLHLRWVTKQPMRDNAFDAMTGIGQAAYYTVTTSDHRRRFTSERPRRTPLTRPTGRLTRRMVPAEVIGVPTDEAGVGLAAGQLLGVLSGVAARLVNGWSQLAGLGVLAGVVYVVIGLFYLTVFAVLAIPVLALIAEGGVSDAVARLKEISDMDALLALVEEVVPGLLDRAPGWLNSIADWASTVLRVGLTVVNVLVVTLATLFTILVADSLAVGYDGGSLIWSSPVTTSAFPVGRSRATLVPALTMTFGSLAHSWLTSSPQGVDEVARAIERILAEPTPAYS
jgi:hypothetical protein